MTNLEQNLMLLGEAKSAVAQCAALLGADDANAILAILDQAQNRLDD